MTFPITIRCSNPDEFSQSEQGSFEDALDRGEDVSDHPYTVLGKLQTRIRIENREQLRNIWYACCTGTFQYNHTRAAQTVHSQLKPYIEEHAPEDLNRYGYPCGL
jgi:hypothetical protein